MNGRSADMSQSGGMKEQALVRRARVALAKLDAHIASHQRSLAEAQERRKHGDRSEPILGSLSLLNMVREGGVISSPSDTLNISVTPAMRARALSVASVLLGLLKNRHLFAWIEDGQTRVGLHGFALHRCSFSMRISEITEKVSNAPDVLNAPLGWRATGRLRITLREGPRGDFRIRDEGEVFLEQQLDSLVDYVALAVAGAPERERTAGAARAVRVAEVEAAKAAEAERAHATAEEQRRQEIEAVRREDLGREAAAWRQASDVREYVAALLGRVGMGSQGALSAWVAWAIGVADSLDPVARRLQQLGIDAAPSTRASGAKSGLKAVKIKQVIEKVSLSQSTIYALIAKGAFPQPFELTPGRVAWIEEDIDAWLVAQAELRVPRAGSEEE